MSIDTIGRLCQSNEQSNLRIRERISVQLSEHTRGGKFNGNEFNFGRDLVGGGRINEGDTSGRSYRDEDFYCSQQHSDTLYDVEEDLSDEETGISSQSLADVLGSFLDETDFNPPSNRRKPRVIPPSKSFCQIFSVNQQTMRLSYSDIVFAAPRQRYCKDASYIGQLASELNLVEEAQFNKPNEVLIALDKVHKGRLVCEGKHLWSC
jgi:hypothetical protein